MKRSSVFAALLMILSLSHPASAAPPSNDDFGNASDLGSTLPITVKQNAFPASEEPGEPRPTCYPHPPASTLWFSFRPSEKTSLVVDTTGTEEYAMLAIYTGSDVQNLHEVVCNATATAGDVYWTRVTALLNAQTTYYIQVTNFGCISCQGEVELVLTLERRRITPGVRRGIPTSACEQAASWYLNRGFDPTAELVLPRCDPKGTPIAGNWVHAHEWPTEGSGIMTLGIRRHQNWYLSKPHYGEWGNYKVVPFGRSVAIPVAGDRDGDGSTDIGVVDGNVWFFDTNLNGFCDHCGIAYGSAADKKVLGDWGGDGIFTPGVRKGNVWYLENDIWSDGKADVVFAFGSASDVPLVGDWDGDGEWTVGVRKGNVWFLNNDVGPNADIVFTYGKPSDLPLVADWGLQPWEAVG
jgi:hypothetical protein